MMKICCCYHHHNKDMSNHKNMIIKMIAIAKKITNYYHLAANYAVVVMTDAKISILEGTIVIFLGNIQILLISSLETEIHLILR